MLCNWHATKIDENSKFTKSFVLIKVKISDQPYVNDKYKKSDEMIKLQLFWKIYYKYISIFRPWCVLTLATFEVVSMLHAKGYKRRRVSCLIPGVTERP